MTIADYIKNSEEIEAKATAGPFRAVRKSKFYGIEHYSQKSSHWIMLGMATPVSLNRADAEFVVHSLNDLHKFRNALKVAVEALENTYGMGIEGVGMEFKSVIAAKKAISQIQAILEGK